MKRSKLMGIAALLLLMHAAPLFAAGNAEELIDAARDGDMDAARALVAVGTDVNEKRYGYTALMRTAGNGHTDTVKALIAAGADVNAQDKDGNTALSLALENGHAETANMLSNAGAR